MPESDAKKRTRSPSYPAIGLEDALDKMRILYEREHFAKIPVVAALDHWGHSSRSGAGFRVLGALKHYGLLDEERAGAQRFVWLSDRAKTLRRGPNDPQWNQECKDAALEPAIHAKLWDKWGPDALPSDQTMRFSLEEMGFNPRAIKKFIATLRSTLEFSGLLGDGRLTDRDDEKPDKEPQGGELQGLGADPQRDPVVPPENAPATQNWDLTIPLMSGKRALLRVPIPLSELDFDLLQRAVILNLDTFKASITRQAHSPQREDCTGEDD